MYVGMYACMYVCSGEELVVLLLLLEEEMGCGIMFPMFVCLLMVVRWVVLMDGGCA